MKILLANEAVVSGGGVDTYLQAIVPALAGRGHELALVCCRDSPRIAADNPLAALPCFRVTDAGLPSAVEAASAWEPDLCFSHNVPLLALDAALLERMPTFKFMHGFFGTCLSGEKSFAFPTACLCDRKFGVGCLAYYLPRRCGGLNPRRIFAKYGWVRRQFALLQDYTALIVASEYMRVEYANHGVPGSRLFCNPLFSTANPDAPVKPAPPDDPTILFVGRMTPRKGGRTLIEAVASLNRHRRRPVTLRLAGDGPARPDWERLTRRLGVPAIFCGWASTTACHELYRGATLLAVPSRWPEPFGLVGLEAAAFGVPAVAFEVGGISQWLHDGVNGWLVSTGRLDASALAQTLAAALADPAEIQRRSLGAKRMAAIMNSEAHVARLETIFQTALAPI